MSEPAAPPPPEQVPVSVQGVAMEEKKTKRSTNWGVIMLIISLIIVAGYIGYVMYKDRKNIPNNNGMSFNSQSISYNGGYGYKNNYM